MVEPIKVGRFIAQNRKNLNLTQKELAEKLGVTDRAVSKWENGVSIVKDTTPNITTPRLYGT